MSDKLREAALAEPEQEPVACRYCHWSHTMGAVYFDPNCVECVKRMTAPPRREWVGLTDDDIGQWIEEEHDVLRWAEAKLKERNT